MAATRETRSQLKEYNRVGCFQDDDIPEARCCDRQDLPPSWIPPKKEFLVGRTQNWPTLMDLTGWTETVGERWSFTYTGPIPYKALHVIIKILNCTWKLTAIVGGAAHKAEHFNSKNQSITACATHLTFKLYFLYLFVFIFCFLKVWMLLLNHPQTIHCGTVIFSYMKCILTGKLASLS